MLENQKKIETHSQIIDQFGRKRCPKKSKDVDYKLYKSFFRNILLYMNVRLSKIRSVHTYRRSQYYRSTSLHKYVVKLFSATFCEQ